MGEPFQVDLNGKSQRWVTPTAVHRVEAIAEFAFTTVEAAAPQPFFSASNILARARPSISSARKS